jgi:hypothetical protein
MDDYTEHRLILDKAVQHLEALGKDTRNSRFCARLKQSLRTVPIHPYVCCFSSKPDLLSQWRAYSDDGAGFAIGFSRGGIEDRWASRLRELVTSREVEYEPANQERKLRELIDWLLARYLKWYASQETVETYEGLEIADAHSRVWDLAAFCKNQGFQEEAEYRIVRMPPATDLASPDPRLPDVGPSKMCFRVTANRLVPYFTFRFREEDVREIRLGPRNRQPEIAHSVGLFLRHNGYDIPRDKIIPSAITYGSRL